MAKPGAERATNPCVAPPYIAHIKYEQLVEANARAAEEAQNGDPRAGVDERSREILNVEAPYIIDWRNRCGVERPAGDPMNTLTALALSGGGIRSATFALGVTQALAACDLMRRFDYLSTVSGGGYLGASLTWLTRGKHHDHRRPGGGLTFAMDRDHFPYPVDPPLRQQERLAKPAQDEQLIYLRHHGKYLTPGKGIDLVSAIGVVLRGFFLNVLVWLPLLAAVLFGLMLVQPFEPAFSALKFGPAYQNGYAWLTVLAAVTAIVFGIAAVLYSFATFLSGVDKPRRYQARRYFESWMKYPLWTVVIAAAVAVIPLIHEHNDWFKASGVISVLTGLATAIGTFLKSRSDTADKGVTLSVVAPAGAILVLYGLLILAYSWAVHVYACRNFLPPLADVACHTWLPPTSVGLVVLALLTGYFVNVNLITVHRFYRDRLMEAFMPDRPVSAEANRGDVRYTDLAKCADVAKLHEFGKFGRDGEPRGPYHLLNTNVILVSSKEWNWRTRGGDSFVLSPLLCGSNATGWCRTTDFLGGDMTLATAMAISGAAANPYAGGGLFRNRPVAVLMSLANVRLGYWVSNPNPEKKFWKGRTHFGTAWRELSGKLDERGRLVQLSDGGHFDNLGIYELIRRRVRLIVACDGTADPQFAFSDFITLLARIEADFGARIRFNEGSGLEVFMPRSAAGFPRNTQLAQKGFTVGRITYSDGSEGDLIYVTTTLFKGLGLQTLGYRAANPDFPDQTTADQFFDEAQFEAYRQLGYSVGQAVIADRECCRIFKNRLDATLPTQNHPVRAFFRRVGAALA